ncbi:hypothetical protein H4S14_003504 [Agrobacterium vitis]|nr:hypothetical protein [Agrobacterium vitis]MBE1439739.1 hypothetical protein [Agrobacterium vitis]
MSAQSPTSPNGKASRKRRQKGREPLETTPKAAPEREESSKPFRAVMKTDRFKASVLLAGFGLFLLAVSQSIPHDYGFAELGALFTFSVYDLVLAMLGIAVACAMMETPKQFAITIGLFTAVLAVMLLFFDPIFVAIRDSALGDMLYLVAPSAVAVSGASLWLSGKWRDRAMLATVVLVAFSFSLFVGLDDFGVGIPVFAISSVLSALWIILAPAFLLRCFKGGWLKIPSRILGSWLIVIAIIVTVSLYVPLPIKTQPGMDLGQPNLDMNGEDTGLDDPAFQDKGAYGSMNTDGLVPEFLKEEPKPDPNAPSVFDGLKTPKIGG